MLPGIILPPRMSAIQSWNKACGATVTLNSSDKNSHITLSGGNLTATGTFANHAMVRATNGLPQGKRGYFEITYSGLTNSGGSRFSIWGLQDTTNGVGDGSYVGGQANGAGWGYDLGGGTFYLTGLGSYVSISTALVNSTLGLIYDSDMRAIWFVKSDGTFLSGSPYTLATPQGYFTNNNTYLPAISFYNNDSSVSATFNFGATAFVRSISGIQT